MKIMLVHNYYQQPGGEDVVFENEVSLLNMYNHEVETYTQHNQEIDMETGIAKARLFINTIWNHRIAQDFEQVLNRFRPDVVHFVNTFPKISPAAYYKCQEKGIPVVQTVQNYRLICPSAVLLRDGHICEDCIGKVPLPGIWHACYRGSRLQTSAVASLLVFHRLYGTWQNAVNKYIAATDFSRLKLIQGGLPSSKISVIPNFLVEAPSPVDALGTYVLFVGRVSTEKGVRTLVEAWNHLSDIPLKLIGGGPLLDEIKFTSGKSNSLIEFMGHQPKQTVIDLMKGSRFLIFPSEWYEGFPMTIVEAFACGIPVVTSRLGGMEEIVTDGVTGLHFTPGSSSDLMKKVRQLWQDPAKCMEMGQSARREFEEDYTANANYEKIMSVYRQAIQSKIATGSLSKEK